MGYLSTVGLFSVMFGLLIMFIGRRSKGEIVVEIGKFRGPVWFLLLMFGFFLMFLDSLSF